MNPNNLAQEDTPLYKAENKGFDSLSNVELLSVLVGGNSADIELCRSLLNKTKNNLIELSKLNTHDFVKAGVNKAKALKIQAAIELGRRKQSQTALQKMTVQSSEDIAAFLKPKLADLQYEAFCVLFLNRANKVNHFEIISRGGITGTVADPRMILKIALEYNATSVVLSHNHPSGNLRPSHADEQLTMKIKEAAKYFDIRVLDHIIISEDGYFSFADEGIL